MPLIETKMPSFTSLARFKPQKLSFEISVAVRKDDLNKSGILLSD